MTRDSRLWSVLFWVGVVATALAELTDPATYGIPASWMPYIRLVALVSAIVGGKLGVSYLRGIAELPRRRNWRGVPAVVLPLILALGITGCDRATPRHDTTVSLGVLVTSMRALQNGELALYSAGTGALSAEQHRAYNGKLAAAWGHADDAVSIVEAWTPGAGVPANLQSILATISGLIATDPATSATTRAFSADKSIAWLSALIQLVVAGKDAIVEIGEAISNAGGTSDAATLLEDNALLADLHAQIATARAAALAQAQAGS